MALVAFAGLIRHAAGQTQYTVDQIFTEENYSSSYIFLGSWSYVSSLSWFHFWYGSGHSQVPDRRTDLTGDVDAVLMQKTR